MKIIYKKKLNRQFNFGQTKKAYNFVESELAILKKLVSACIFRNLQHRIILMS